MASQRFQRTRAGLANCWCDPKVDVEPILADELSSGRKSEPVSQWELFDYNNRSETVSNEEARLPIG
jgi:hypothetical protein